jgi:hypothetical protein
MKNTLNYGFRGFHGWETWGNYCRDAARHVSTAPWRWMRNLCGSEGEAADGEADAGNEVDPGEGHFEGVVVLVEGDEGDVVGAAWGAFDVLHDDLDVAVVDELHEVDFTVDEEVERVEDFVGDDVAGLEQGVHGVAYDVDGAVAEGHVGYGDVADDFTAVGEEGVEACGGVDVVEGYDGVGEFRVGVVAAMDDAVGGDGPGGVGGVGEHGAATGEHPIGIGVVEEAEMGDVLGAYIHAELDDFGEFGAGNVQCISQLRLVVHTT